jgi:amino acid adenylation domain-containing protein
MGFPSIIPTSSHIYRSPTHLLISVPMQMHSNPAQFSTRSQVAAEVQTVMVETDAALNIPVTSPLPPALDMPTDRPRIDGAARQVQRLDWQGFDRIQASASALAHDLSVPLSIVLLAGFQLLLYRYSRQSQFAIAALESGQRRWIISDLDPNQSVTQVIEQLSETWQQATGPRNYTLDALATSEFSSNPFRGNQFAFSVLTETDRLVSELLKWDLKVGLVTDAEGRAVSSHLDYDGAMFDPQSAGRLQDHLTEVLRQMVKDPQQSIETLAYIPEAEVQQLLYGWNATAVDYPREACIHELFEAQVKRTPDNIAVSFETSALTYAQLNAQANQFAHYLRGLGVGQETLVGLCIDRSEKVFVAMLGIMKAGGTYIPMDPGYPPDRLALMLEDAEAPVLVFQGQETDIFPHYVGQRVDLAALWDVITQQSTENLPNVTTPENLIYIIYTSGSTGKPKGVMIPHQGFVNLMTAMAAVPGLSEGDRFLSPTSISFDMVGPELYLPLMCGAEVHMVSRAVATDGKRMAEVLRSSGATAMQATPATWRLLIQSGWEGSQDLTIICGGEAMPPDLVQPLLQRCQALWNFYGPTETTVWSTAYQITEVESSTPVGRPLANTQLYILDAQMQPVPVNHVGELLIAGDGVARGYLKREALSAERFIANPFRSGERMYRTGDLARFRPDGQLDFLGRMDHQVKVRGYRIELGEIESGLVQHPDVRAAVVMAREDSPGDQRLVGYVTLASGATATMAELRRSLKQTLPDYMVPQVIMAVERFPLSPNGKVDRKAMPMPPQAQRDLDGEYVAAADNLEQQLVALWEEVLQVKPVGAHDSFFDLGGHSLLVVRLLARIREVLHQDMPAAAVFQAPSVTQFAQLLRQPNQQLASPAAVLINPGQGNRSPLFCVHVLGQQMAFFKPMARYMPEQPMIGLSADLDPTHAGDLTSLEAIAQFYIQELKKLQPEGPYFLAGVSHGGDVIFEMAQQLRRAGEGVALLAMMDTYGPQNQYSGFRNKLKFHGQALLSLKHRYLIGRVNLYRDRLRTTALLIYARLLEKRGKLVPADLQFLRVVEQNTQSGSVYQHQPYDGDLLMFRATDDLFYGEDYRRSALGWRSIILGEITVIDVTGDHMGILQVPHVGAIAQALKAHLPQELS